MLYSGKHCSTILRCDVAIKFLITQYFQKKIFNIGFFPFSIVNKIRAYEIGDPCLQFFI